MQTFGTVGLTIIVVAGFICLMRIISAIVELRTASSKLEPGKCECGHARCSHKKGRKACTASVYNQRGNVGLCACEIYISAAASRDEQFAKQCGISL